MSTDRDRLAESSLIQHFLGGGEAPGKDERWRRAAKTAIGRPDDMWLAAVVLHLVNKDHVPMNVAVDVVDEHRRHCLRSRDYGATTLEATLLLKELLRELNG